MQRVIIFNLLEKFIVQLKYHGVIDFCHLNQYAKQIGRVAFHRIEG